jgi:hypothetical protein
MGPTAIGVTVGSALLGAGGGVLGGLIGNSGGGGGINTKAIKETMAEYISQVKAAIETGRANVAGAVKGMDKKIQKGVGELRNASDAETKAFWNNLGIFNDGLINSASALVDTYDGDVMQALETLQSNVVSLNEGYAQDMGEEISRYGSIEDALNAKLSQDNTLSQEKFLGRVSEAKAEYEQKSLAEADSTKAESMSLGDQFVAKSDAALGRFEQFISPENATATLDSLSKSVFQTRQQLLAEADPRALELSALADENASAMMSGRISADMQANVARSSAMRALQGGFGASSEMGRGLTARDLGLTSLDLMKTGFDMNQQQRRLNYDTRLAGVQDTATNMFGEMRAGQNALLNSTIGVAESDRNQRLGAVQEASGQRLQTFDRLFGANMGVADTLRGQDMTLASTMNANARDANIRSTGMRMGATQDIYNNAMGLSDTVFNTGLGLANQKLSTGLSVAGDIYKTNVGGAGTVYNTRMNTEGNIFGTRGQAAIAGMQAISAFEGDALQAMSGALGNQAATNANIPVMQAAQRNAGAMQSAQLWGSALQAGSSLAGSFLGSQNWSNMGGRSFGGSSYLQTPAAQGGPQYNAWFNKS